MTAKPADGAAPVEAPEKKKPRRQRVTVEVDDDDDSSATPGATITRTPGDREVPNAGTIAWQPLFSDFADPNAVACIRVVRTWPKEPPLGGTIGEFPADMTEENIRQRAGGGSYECTAVNRMGRPLARKVVPIAGRPKIPVDDLDPLGSPAAPSGNADQAKLLERVIEIQTKSFDQLAKMGEEARTARERESREFQLMMKSENAHMLTIIQESNKSTMAIVAESNKSSMAALSTGFANMMEFAAKMSANNNGGGGGSEKDTIDTAERLAKLMNANSPWSALAMMGAHMMPPRPGTPEWFFSQGKDLPPAMLRALEMQGGGGARSPSTSTPAATGGGAADPEETDDAIGMFLEWIAQTPDSILAHALMARHQEKTIPEAFTAAMDAALKGDEGPIGAILTEYGALDLAPRLRAAAALMLQAAGARK